MATKKPATAKSRTTKRTVKTAATRKPAAVNNRRAGLTLDRIWLAAAVLFGLGALAALWLMQPLGFEVTQTHLTSDALLSQQETVFTSANRPLYDLELRWALAILLALSMAAPILYLTKLKDWYGNRVASRRIVETRWLDLGITAGLMVEILALIDGYTDFATLKLMVGAMLLTAGLGWLAERQNEKVRRPDWSAFGLSVLAGALPWLAIIMAKIGTLLWGEVRQPWYAYAACFAAFIGFCLLAWNQWNQHRRIGAWKDYAFVERNYALIMTVTKAVFAGILIVGLLK